MKLKDRLIIILIILEFILSCAFLVLYLVLPNESHVKSYLFLITVVMLFVTFITIYHFDMGDKVKSIVKKVGEIVFNLTVGALLRVFDAFFNMATGTRQGNLKVITGYEDKVFSVKQHKKKRKASYKSYRLMDNREKVRFLYYKAVTKAVRKGFAFKESDTPFEVNDKLINRKYLKKSGKVLSEIYNVSRYDSEGHITDKMVEVMKESG